jgi:hypothetical protein
MLVERFKYCSYIIRFMCSQDEDNNIYKEGGQLYFLGSMYKRRKSLDYAAYSPSSDYPSKTDYSS